MKSKIERFFDKVSDAISSVVLACFLVLFLLAGFIIPVLQGLARLITGSKVDLAYPVMVLFMPAVPCLALWFYAKLQPRQGRPKTPSDPKHERSAHTWILRTTSRSASRLAREEINMQNKHRRQPRWLDLLVRRFGYVPQHRIPEVGATMHPDCLIDDDGEVVACPSVEVLAVDDISVRYKLPDGRCFTRSKRGFMKHYSHAPNADVLARRTRQRRG